MERRGAYLLGGGGVGPGGSGGGGAEGLRQLGEHLREGKRITVRAGSGTGEGGTRWREGTDASGSEPPPRDAQHLRRDRRWGWWRLAGDGGGGGRVAWTGR